jgi:hypothetical protein
MSGQVTDLLEDKNNRGTRESESEGRHYWHDAGAQYNWRRTIIATAIVTIFIMFALWDIGTQNGIHIKNIVAEAANLFLKLVIAIENAAGKIFSDYRYKF